MSFPSSPLNGAITRVNGILYQYYSADNVWKRVAENYNLFTANTIIAGNITANSNVVANATYSSSYYWANGTPFASSSFGNADVSAYLDSYYIYANANAASQATSIDSINANVGAYQTYANANAATQATAIDSINANVGAYQIYANANSSTQVTSFNTLDANVGAYHIWANASITSLQSNAAIQGNLIDILTGNAATQGSLLDVLVANAAVQSANLTSLLSNAAAQEASLTVLVNNAAAQSSAIDTINANIGAYQTWSNTTTYANANVAAYLTATYPITYDGALRIGTGSGPDVHIDALNNIYVGHGTANHSITTISGDLSATGNSTFSASTLISGSANLTINNTSNITVKTGAGLHLQSGATFIGDAGTFVGNLSAGNLSASGFYWANGAPFTSSSYGNTDVSAYLDSYYIYANANAAVQTTAIDALNANIIATNAAIITANTGMKSYVDAQVVSAGGYGNTQVAAYLTGNVTVGNIQAAGYYFANGAPFSSSNYGNTDVASYLPTYSGVLTAGNIITTSGVFWANGTAYSTGSGGGGSGTGITYTAGTTPPVSGNIKGDQWYNTTTNVLYEYLYDGTSYYWVDIVGPAGTFVSTGYVSRIYTTDGIASTYTVSTGCAVTNVLVFLNGVAQTPTTDYTISGDVLTLVEVPAASQILQVRELPR